jgi:GntR family transcriptional repressor for pyruvate dehydrogenase complex
MVARLSDKCELRPPARLPDQISQILSHEIEHRRLKPGDLLPTESELAMRFQVSRAVVREALSRLKHEGLVDSRQGKGVIIIGTIGRNYFRLDEPARPKRGDIAALYELRALLEGEAAALAAKRIKPRQAERLERQLAKMSRDLQEGRRGAGADLEFHKAIADASGNRHLRDLMSYLNGRLVQIIRAARQNTRHGLGSSSQVQGEHLDILKAIKTGDANLARQAALKHLHNSAKRLGAGWTGS